MSFIQNPTNALFVTVAVRNGDYMNYFVVGHGFNSPVAYMSETLMPEV